MKEEVALKLLSMSNYSVEIALKLIKERADIVIQQLQRVNESEDQIEIVAYIIGLTEHQQ
jgi:heterodisulfide reductase subunit C